jgi:acylphosphatase
LTVRTYRVRGRVQGVGFRYFVIRLGRKCGVPGAVRNELDGTVTAVAEGDEEALARFRAGLENGPPAARVTGVEESEAGERPAAAEFDAVF